MRLFASDIQEPGRIRVRGGRRYRRLVGVAVLAVAASTCGEDRVTPTGPGPVPPVAPVPVPPAPLTNPGIAFASNRDGTWRIYVANPDGSGATPIALGSRPAWSPDGSRIAFVQANHGLGFTGPLVTVAPDGSGLRSLGVSGFDPAWSPDGRTLAFATAVWDGLSGTIELVNADGSSRRRLYSADDHPNRPAWSPDGRRIAFAVGTYIDVHSGVWIMNADGSGVQRLGPLDSYQPVWSPHGLRVAYSSNFGIWISNETGSGANLIIAGTGLQLGDWSADGRQILFARITGDSRNQSCRIYVIDVAGGTERQLIPNVEPSASATYCDMHPVWARR